MRVAAALAWLAALAVSAARGAANIDSDGFVQDGETTYCDGVTSARGALVFENLKTSSAGKCPLTVAMTTTVKSFSTGDTQVQVEWSAALSSKSAATSMFPRAVDSTTGLPKDVIASLMRACKSGSNCASESDVIVPATIPNGNETSTGAFDKTGKKALRRYQFKFPSAGTYVIVGKVVLPGDPVLNISATEFVSFRKIQVSADGVPVPSTGADTSAGTVKPADKTTEGETWVESNSANLTPTPTTSPVKAQLDVQAQDSKDSALKSSDQKSGSNANVIVLGSIAGLGFIIAVAYFATAKNEKPKDTHDGALGNDGVYRLTDMADMGKDSMQQMPAFGAPKPHPVPPPHPQQHKYHPQQQPAAWKASPPMGAPMAPPPQQHHQQQHQGSFDGHDSFDGMSDFGSIIGSEMMQSQMSLNDSMFNSLHDSQVAMPLPKPKKVRASSLSSLGDLDDSDEEFFDGGASEVFDGGASEIYSDVGASQFKPQSTFNPADTQVSTYSWLDRDSETDLTETMHERLTKEYNQI